MAIKYLQLEFEEEEFEKLKRKKGKRTWREVLLSGLEADED